MLPTPAFSGMWIFWLLAHAKPPPASARPSSPSCSGRSPPRLSVSCTAPGHDAQRGKSVRWSQRPGAAVVQVCGAEPSPRRVPTDQAPHPWARCLGQHSGRGEAAELQKQSLHLASSGTNTKSPPPGHAELTALLLHRLPFPSTPGASKDQSADGAQV